MNVKKTLRDHCIQAGVMLGFSLATVFIAMIVAISLLKYSSYNAYAHASPFIAEQSADAILETMEMSQTAFFAGVVKDADQADIWIHNAAHAQQTFPAYYDAGMVYQKRHALTPEEITEAYQASMNVLTDLQKASTVMVNALIEADTSKAAPLDKQNAAKGVVAANVAKVFADSVADVHKIDVRYLSRLNTLARVDVEKPELFSTATHTDINEILGVFRAKVGAVIKPFVAANDQAVAQMVNDVNMSPTLFGSNISFRTKFRQSSTLHVSTAFTHRVPFLDVGSLRANPTLLQPVPLEDVLKEES